MNLLVNLRRLPAPRSSLPAPSSLPAARCPLPAPSSLPAARCLLPAPASCLLPATLCLLLGCGTRDFEVAPVSGRVTVDARPVEGIHVSFQPQAVGKEEISPGPGSFGLTDAEGRYRLQLVKPTEAGAVVGTHRVRFALREEREEIDDAGRPLRDGLPSRYHDGSITFEVPPGGTDQADFQLTSQ